MARYAAIFFGSIILCMLLSGCTTIDREYEKKVNIQRTIQQETVIGDTP